MFEILRGAPCTEGAEFKLEKNSGRASCEYIYFYVGS